MNPSTLVTYLIVLLMAFVPPRTCLANTFFITEVKTADANPDLARSLHSLVVTAVAGNGGTVVASEGSAEFTLRTELIHLGQAYVLTVTKLKQTSFIFASNQKAASIEELDDAIARAVRAAMISTPTKQDLRVGEVKPHEEDQFRRRIKARDSSYLGFGPAGFQNMGVSSLSYNFAIGHLWEVTPFAAIRLLGNVVTSNDWKTYFFDGELGLNYYLSDTDSAPYLNGDFGLGMSGSGTTPATTIGAFAGTVGVGYLFFRTSTTQFDLFAGYTMIFGHNTIGSPGFYSLRIGVLL
jgi:hypothetical protein